MAFPRTLVLVAALTLAACGGTSADQHLSNAEAALASSSWDDAVAAAAEGLATDGAAPATKWRLELARLEAQARGGDADGTKGNIERLAGEYAAQVKGPLYVTTANQLSEAGQAEGAILVLDAGAKRFPDSADIKQAIEQIAAAGNEDENSMLRSLGYIE